MALAASNLIPFTIEGTSAERTAQSSGTISVGYLIKGLEAAGYTGKDRHIDCLYDPILPEPGASHFPGGPKVPQLICRRTRLEILNSDQARFFADYGGPGDDSVDAPVQNDTVQTEFERDFAIFRTATNFNADGTLIRVPYAAPLPPGVPGPPQTIHQRASVEDDEVIEVIRFRRREDASGKAYTAADVYIGHVNPVSATPFTIANVTYPARTWLCRNINMTYTRLANNVVVFDCVYEFAHRSRIVRLNGGIPAAIQALGTRAVTIQGITYIDIGWDEMVFYQNADGEIPDDVVFGNGMILATPKPSADFVGLNLIVP